MEIKLTLPIPPSVNTAFAGYKKRHKSEQYLRWEREAAIVFSELSENYEIHGDEWLEVKYTFYMPLYYKNGKKKVIDTFNYEKILTDFMTQKERIPGFEDHKIYNGHVYKRESERWEVEVVIGEVQEEK